MSDDVAHEKAQMRSRLLGLRRRLRPADLIEAAERISQNLLATPQLQRAATVAAYVSVGTEPGTGPFLDALFTGSRPCRVLLPRLQADGDLDWATYHGPTSLAPAGMGTLAPMSPLLGLDAVATADVVICPGVAVDRLGVRLGRGGGSYDRALARVPAGTFTCVVLHEGELVDDVPAEPHDRRVSAACLPSGMIWTGQPRRGK